MFVELQSRLFPIDNQMGSQVCKVGQGTIYKVRQHFLECPTDMGIHCNSILQFLKPHMQYVYISKIRPVSKTLSQDLLDVTLRKRAQSR